MKKSRTPSQTAHQSSEATRGFLEGVGASGMARL